MERANRQHNEASARILAATLTLISRERGSLPPPFSLWYPVLNAKTIKELALDAAFDRSKVIWADDSYPARGVLVFHPMELESALLGKKPARLKGPFLVDLASASRQKTAWSLAEKGKAQGLRDGCRFLSVKLPHDPALIRGFTEGGFAAAEITPVLEGPLAERRREDLSLEPKLTGIIIRPSDEADAAGLLSQLGDLFYDGHHLHSPFLPEDFLARLWRKLAEEGLRSGDSAVFAADQRQGRAAGFAMAALSGAEAVLSILHVNEQKRNLGLGAMILKNLFAILYEKGARTIRAETASWNLPALSLYISLGLRPRAPLIAMHAAL